MSFAFRRNGAVLFLAFFCAPFAFSKEELCIENLSDAPSASTSKVNAMWEYLNLKGYDENRIQILQEVFALANLPDNKIAQVKDEFETLLMKGRNGGDLERAAIFALDGLEREAQHEAMNYKSSVPAKTTHKLATNSSGTSNLNTLLTFQNIKITADTPYTVIFERPDPTGKPIQKNIRFSEKVAKFLNDPSRHTSERSWIEAICRGMAKVQGQSGFKRLTGDSGLKLYYDFEVKLLGPRQDKRLGVMEESDGTLFVRDVFTHL